MDWSCRRRAERLGGDTGFELGGQVSSFSFHRSDLGGDLTLSDQLKFQQTSGSVLRDHFTVPHPRHRL
jgi:hypothetical protein